jgi:penicillin-binding protein 2
MTTNLMPDDRRSLTVRLTALQYIIALAFAALAVGFWIFQIAQHQKFAEMAENNHQRRLPLPAPRGVLFDRDGRVLVENQNIFNIALVREQTKDIDQTLKLLAAATGVDEEQLRDTVARRRREPSYRPIVLIENATKEQVIAVWARRWELPGIIYQEVPSRKYPASDMAAHAFGYVG